MAFLKNIFLKITFTLDAVAIHIFGIRYLKLVREATKLERCDYLIEAIKNLRRNNLRILDVGSGAGLALLYLDMQCRQIVKEYVGVDLCAAEIAPRYKYTRMQHRFLEIDLDSDWQLGKFDVVFCSEVLEHLTKDERLFSKLCDHVVSNGLVIVTTPNKYFFLEKAKTFENMAKNIKRMAENPPPQYGGHVRIGYTRNDFLEMAHNCNIKVNRIDYISPFNIKEWKNYRKANRIGKIGNIIIQPLLKSRKRKPPVLFVPPNEEFAINYLSICGVFQRNDGLNS